jgi:four helix bundle protein
MAAGAARTSAASPNTPCCIASCENTLRRLRIVDFGLGIAQMEGPEFMTKDELKRRTRQFALDVIRLVELLPRSRTTEVLGKQLLRSGTSVGANYRAACRAKSSADFVSKMGIVEEEADEAIYWMELLVDSGCVRAAGVRALLQEADELLAIAVSSIKTARITRYRNR